MHPSMQGCHLSAPSSSMISLLIQGALAVWLGGVVEGLGTYQNVFVLDEVPLSVGFNEKGGALGCQLSTKSLCSLSLCSLWVLCPGMNVGSDSNNRTCKHRNSKLYHLSLVSAHYLIELYVIMVWRSLISFKNRRQGWKKWRRETRWITGWLGLLVSSYADLCGSLWLQYWRSLLSMLLAG